MLFCNSKFRSYDTSTNYSKKPLWFKGIQLHLSSSCTILSKILWRERFPVPRINAAGIRSEDRLPGIDELIFIAYPDRDSVATRETIHRRISAKELPIRKKQ